LTIDALHRNTLSKTTVATVVGLATLIFAGCATPGIAPATPPTRLGERAIAGATFAVSEFADDRFGPVMAKNYNGELSRNSSAAPRVRAAAWFDYDGIMVSYYVRNIDSASPSSTTGSVLPVVVPVGGDFYAESLKFWGVTTLAGKLLGFRTGLSTATAGLGLITGILGDADNWFIADARRLWKYRQGSSLTLIGLHTSDDLKDASGYENATAQAAGIFAGADMTPVQLMLNVSSQHGMTGGKIVWAVDRIVDPAQGSPDRRDNLILAETRNFRTWHQSPLAQGRDAIAGWTEVRIPHVAHQLRADNIRSPRELYEKKILLSGAMPYGWFAIYTDTDPSDGTRKVFVTRKGDHRTLAFPVPEVPSN
jgi:hypothetical protein